MRLFELHGQALPEGAVKYRVASRVCEIGDDDCVFAGERVRLAYVQPPEATRRQRED
jgi:hypothetical protein